MKYAQWWLPVVLMAVLAPFTPSLDLTISNAFYDSENKLFVSNAFYDFFFEYGPALTLFTVFTAIIIFFLSFLTQFFRLWRSPALLVILTVGLGAGLLVNAVLKDHWGRPRPKQVIEFGGAQAFRPFYQPNFFHQPEPSKSFPCGHCSMGFAFFAVALAGKRLSKRSIFFLGITLTLFLGLMLSLTRLAQGGHFFSDVLMSALIMWLVTLAFDWLLFSVFRRCSNFIVEKLRAD